MTNLRTSERCKNCKEPKSRHEEVPYGQINKVAWTAYWCPDYGMIMSGPRNYYAMTPLELSVWIESQNVFKRTFAWWTRCALRIVTSTVAAFVFLLTVIFAGCAPKADQPEKPKHQYFINSVVTKKYVVEGNYEVILKKIGGGCPRQLLDMKQPVSFPVEPDVWAILVPHNRAIVWIREYDLHTEIVVLSLDTMKAYDRERHGN